MAKTLIALYDDFETARSVVAELMRIGYGRENISLVANDAAGEFAQFQASDGSDLEPDDSVTAGEGAAFGGIVGALVGLGAALIPGLGPVLAAGPLAAALTGGVVGGATGAATGGIVAALMDLDLSPDEAGYYAEGIRRGGTLVILDVQDDMADHAQDVMERFGPVDLERRVKAWQDTGWMAFDPNAAPYTEDEIVRERALYRTH